MSQRRILGSALPYTGVPMLTIVAETEREEAMVLRLAREPHGPRVACAPALARLGRGVSAVSFIGRKRIAPLRRLENGPVRLLDGSGLAAAALEGTGA